jgi:hypothetical protein
MIMAKNKQQVPPCFGDLDTVFPMGADELRCTPDTCMACGHKTECLRTAMSRPRGIGVREEMVDRAYASGRIGFLKRWSKRKAYNRQKNQMIKKDHDKENQ